MHICLKIEATAEEIAQELIRFREGKLAIALDCGQKPERLIAEVEEALDHMYLMWSRGGGSTSSSSSFVFDHDFYTKLVGYVRSTMSAIETMAANHWSDEDFHFHSLYDNIERKIICAAE